MGTLSKLMIQSPSPCRTRLGLSSLHQSGFRFLGRGVVRGFRSKQSIPKPKVIDVAPIKVKPTQQTPQSSLVKPFLFTVSVCGCSFLVSMIWNYENMRKKFRDLKRGIFEPSPQEQKRFGFRNEINQFWKKLGANEKLMYGIILTNITVFGLWKIPSIQSTMFRYFSSSITHPLPSMVLASFSHIHLFHIFANMYVLSSFAPLVAHMYGHEQFAAVYLSAGVTSSFVSIALQKVLSRPSTISIGASGAIMGLLGIVCVTMPNSQLSIAFLSEIFPHSFSADTGMKAIIAFDILGLVLGWRVLDHAGHLGGMLFGILYAKYGTNFIWGQRDNIIKTWHNIRGKP